MGTSLNSNTINNLIAGSVIYKQGENVDTIGVVLEGRVIVYNQGMKTIMGPGSFIGISDVNQNRYMSNYVAYENTSLYVFQIGDRTDMNTIFHTNKDYGGLAVVYLNKYIKELSDIVTSLRNRADELYVLIHKVYDEYFDIYNMNGRIYSPLIEDDELKKYESKNIFDRDALQYYNECLKLPEEIQKAYFSYSSNLTCLHIFKQSEFIHKLIEESIQISTYGKKLFEIMINDENDCIFMALAKIAVDMGRSGAKNGAVINLIDKVIVEIHKTDQLFSEMSGRKLTFDRARMEKVQMDYDSSSAETTMNELDDSFNQILAYAEMQEERTEEIRQIILEFKGLKDKSSITEGARLLRKKIIEAFYELFLKVYLKAYKDQYLSKVIALFLNFGFIDETLLTKEQCIELCDIKDDNNKVGNCRVFTIMQWLNEIYEGRKQPSKNEFDLEYTENLREIKKSRSISVEEEKDYLTNPIRKVEYEIKNMFRYNNRVVSGQISIFVPILYKEIINKTISNMYITTNRINTEINRLLSIDYSAYYREILYYDESKGIKKEYIVKQAFPDIILMPTIGCNSIMWQEIEGRKRDTSGRFLLPIFCEAALFEMLVKLTGRLRFELCRTIEGISWNNVLQKSLTSEYSDYIQSYSKNRDLSEEQKQKIKHQIQKGRNNLREIFTLDYMIWIQNESQGYLRMNKTIRGIMSTYCPFAKEIREHNSRQPIFEEAMGRYLRDRLKKFRSCSLSIQKLEKEHIDIPVELEETLKFYSEL